jgi:formylglycine-generating enzyme required for sulfatase activity
LQVAGGTYYRTYTNTGSGPTGEADPASVSGFRLDKYLVTVGRFRQFVSAWNGGAGYVPPAGSGKHTHVNGGRGLSLVVGSGVVYEPGWVASDDSNIAPTTTNLACMTGYPTWTPAVGGNEQYPVDCVTWAEAYAFCIWDGGFLPSEAEWEYAAGGGSLQREYPWGTMDPGMGNGYAIYRCNYSDRGTCGIAPVGTALQGAGRWGQLDLAGNLNEWNLDYTGKYVNPCTDCAFVTEPFPPARVIRGGDFYLGVSALLPSYRDAFGPDQRQATNGFRCARTP